MILCEFYKTSLASADLSPAILGDFFIDLGKKRLAFPENV